MSSKFALIIGNSEYQDTKLAQLAAPVEDVSGLADVLSDPDICNFDEVSPLINANTATALRSIAGFFAGRDRDDLLLLYFSGHGVLDGHGHLYLAFPDTEYNLLSGTAIAASFITQEMDRCRSQRQVLILDCCHSGAFARGSKSAVGARVGIAYAFEGTGHNRIVLTASDSTQFAWDGNRLIGEAKNSLFTHYLIEGLRTGKADLNTDGNISLDELYDYVYRQVVQNAPAQTPGKWSYQKKEDVFIARNPHAGVEKAPYSEKKQATETHGQFPQPTTAEAEAARSQSNTKEPSVMNEQPSPRSSKPTLAILFFLIVIAGGWLFFQFSQGGQTGDAGLAAAARDEMLARQAEAENAGAPALAEGAYGQGLEYARQGGQEYEEGNYPAARLSYISAADLFSQAIREADSNLQAETEMKTEEMEKQPAIAARAEMSGLRGQAENARARALAEAAFNRAMQEEQQAEQEFAAGNYSLAELSYKRAGELFKIARNEAQTKALEAETDLNAVKRAVESLRQEMLREKAAAEQYESISLAKETLEQARAKEQSGDRNFRAGSRNGFLAAQNFYAEAKDRYGNALEEARAKAREEAIKARQRELAQQEEAARARQQQESEQARNSMAAEKANVAGSPSEKAANSTYQNALKMEAAGEGYLQAGNYSSAGNAFQQAGQLYARSSEEIKNAKESAKATADSEAKAALDKENRAKGEIRSLINSYRQSLEREDVETIIETFKESESQWLFFFRNARDISVSIEDEIIQIDDNNARASFSIKMSYVNTTKNEVEKSVILKDWRLKPVNGQWKVMSQN